MVSVVVVATQDSQVDVARHAPILHCVMVVVPAQELPGGVVHPVAKVGRSIKVLVMGAVVGSAVVMVAVGDREGTVDFGPD